MLTVAGFDVDRWMAQVRKLNKALPKEFVVWGPSKSDYWPEATRH